MHLHGDRQLVVAKDGFPLESPYYADTINVAPGERYSVVVTAEEPGVWVWHCHILTHVLAVRVLRFRHEEVAMRIGVLGTGDVGRTLGSAFERRGHEVLLGSRTAGDGKGTFGEAVAHGEVLVNATAGTASVEAIGASSPDDRAGKVLLDVANPLDFSSGERRLTIANDDSLGETIQRAFPELRVVKSLNTVTASVMVAPSALPGDHVLFLAGEDADAKATVARLLGELGWQEAQLLDLGGLSAARGMEMYLPLWLRLMQTLGTPVFNVGLSRP